VIQTRQLACWDAFARDMCYLESCQSHRLTQTTEKRHTVNTTQTTSIIEEELDQLERRDIEALIFPIIDTNQLVHVRYTSMSGFEVLIKESNGDSVAGPGFKIGNPSHEIDYRTETISYTPAAIGWIGCGGSYGTQPAPGAVTRAAQIADDIANKISKMGSRRRAASQMRAKENLATWIADCAAEQELTNIQRDMVRDWASEQDYICAADIRIRMSIDADYKRNGRDSLELTLADLMNGRDGWLASEGLKVEAQLKPRGRWVTIIGR